MTGRIGVVRIFRLADYSAEKPALAGKAITFRFCQRLHLRLYPVESTSAWSSSSVAVNIILYFCNTSGEEAARRAGKSGENKMGLAGSSNIYDKRTRFFPGFYAKLLLSAPSENLLF